MAQASLDEEIRAEQRRANEDIDRQIAEERGLQARMQQTAQEQGAERKPIYEDLRQAGRDYTETLKANKPRYMPLPVPPNTEEMTAPTSIQKTFGMAAIFALLAAGFTKDRSMAGLHAIGGFMKGAREGSAERAKAAIDDFNNNMKYAIAMNNQAEKEYERIIADPKLTFEQKERELKLKMLEHQDTQWLLELEQKGMNGIHNLMNSRNNLNHQMQMELLRTQQISAQMAHQAAIEKARAGREAQSLKNSDIAKIRDQARLEINSTLPKDSLGQVMLGREWGKTLQERLKKYTDIVNAHTLELARQRGLEQYFMRGGEERASDPASQLRDQVSSGQITDTKDAMSFLARQSVPAAQAAAIVRQVWSEQSGAGIEY